MSILNSNDFAKEHNARRENQRTCFLVYSSREGHLVKVIERLNDFLTNELNFSVFKLDEVRIPGKQLLSNILKYAVGRIGNGANSGKDGAGFMFVGLLPLFNGSRRK